MGNFNAMHVTFGLYLIVVLLIGIAAYFSTRDFATIFSAGAVSARSSRQCRPALRICPAGC